MRLPKLITCFLLCWSGLGKSQEPCSVNKLYPYPIVVQPDSKAHGYSTAAFSAWSYTGKDWRRIPLQVDEKNKRNEFVLDQGLPFTAQTDDGLIDENDEISFYGADLGKDFKQNQIPKDVSQAALAAWKVTVCQEKAAFGTMLLVVNESPAKNSKAFPNAVSLDIGNLQIASSSYRYTFRESQPVLLGDVWLRDQDGKEWPLFSDSAFRLAFRLPWYLPDVTLTDESFRSTLESWQEGPVRTIVAVGVKMKNIFSIFDFHMFSELVFYRNYFQIPTVMEFPFESQDFFKPGSGLAYGIRFANEVPWKVESNLTPLPSTLELLEETGQAQESEQYFARIIGPERSLMLQVQIRSPEKHATLPAPYLIQESMFGATKMAKTWPWLQSLSGDTGVFVDISRVRKGTYNFSLDLFLDSKADLGIHEIFTSPKANWVPLSLR